jgi:phosphoribosyl-AMP cyclohydrolase / phosphoribosyl-ATP pyrophosphohydrolase
MSGERTRREGELNVEISNLRFDERGLMPAVVQDARTREVLTLAYVSEESLRRTLAEGETWFWSRSRRRLWHKGETSGHTQRVVEVRADCDADALVILVEPNGPACHTGERTCFHARLKVGGRAAPGEGHDEDDAGEVADLGAALRDLHAVVEGRRHEMPAGSYTTYLFEQGLNKILKKVGEEAAETIIAAKDEDPAALTAEISDLLYHLFVLMAERGVAPEAVAKELRRRAKGKGEG